MFRMLALAYGQDGRVNLDRVDGRTVVPQSRRHVVPGSGAHDQYAWCSVHKPKGYVVGILALRLLNQLGMTSQETLRQNHNRLVAGVIYLQLPACEITILRIGARAFNLLLRRPDGV